MINKKIIIGNLIILGISVSWVASTQISQRIQTGDNFYCPFFMIWFSTGWLIICFFTSLLKFEKLKQSLAKIELSWIRLFFLSIVFYVLWIVANYLYIFALQLMNASDVTAIFSSVNAFVFIFSIFVLKEKINLMKSASVFFSIFGIVLIALANAEFEGTAKGIIFTLISAISAALYKVYLKKLLGDPDLIVTNMFLGFLGLVNIFLVWPVVLILIKTGVENLEYDSIPWPMLVLSALISFIFNLLINFGIAYTYPLFISIGTIVGIPLNIIIDILINEKSLDWKEILGAGLIILSFAFLILNNYISLRRADKEDSKAQEKLLDSEDIQNVRTDENSDNFLPNIS